MSRKIITTCGTSLLASNCWTIQISINGGLKKMSGCPAYLALRGNLAQQTRWEFIYEKTIKEYLETMTPRALAEQFDMNVWNDTDQILKLPAELASLKGIIKFYEKRQPLNQDDTILLLHSDDAEGKFCAEVIEAVLGNNIGVGCKVSPREIEGLAPSNANEFNQAVREHIWKALINEINNRPNDEYIFNLTGGYKGTAIILGALAYKMHSSADRILIFYLHESSDYRNIVVNGFAERDLCSGYVDISTGTIYNSIGDISRF